MIEEDEPLWVEKYRPHNVASVILPKKLKQNLQSYVDAGFIPNLIFSGPPGIGKTTVAKAMLDELGLDYFFINSSLKGNIDTLRTDIVDFASAVSFNGKRKYVVMDEADYLNATSTQPALRGVIEEFSRNCGFIMTCNFPARLLEAITSRCPIVEFMIPSDEMVPLAGEFLQRMDMILHAEKVQFNPQTIANIIERNFPDWRRTINTIQNLVKDGSISDVLPSSVTKSDLDDLWNHLKNSDFKKVRIWCSDYGLKPPKELFRILYDLSDQYLTAKGQAQLVLTLAKYEYNSAFVANQEINLVAAMVEIMVECEFK
jgi:DNA polymerase III delta prime subunit